MPIVHPCASDGCNTLTMGELCLDCERAALGAPAGTAIDADVPDDTFAVAAPVTAVASGRHSA